MTPEEIVAHVEVDMKEGGLDYQPAYWKMKLLLRIKALVENHNRQGATSSLAPERSDGPLSGKVIEKPFSDSEIKARMVLIEGGKCADCGEIVHLGLCVGGSRNLPYPRPISDDDAKKRVEQAPKCDCAGKWIGKDAGHTSKCASNQR